MGTQTDAEGVAGIHLQPPLSLTGSSAGSRRFIRMAWEHDGEAGAGKWEKATSRNISKLLRSVDFGNAHHGEGTHWIEECWD